MGLDFFEVQIEIEKLFGVHLEHDHLLAVWQSHGNDCTAKELHDIVCQLRVDSGKPVPRSSWNRVKLALAKGLNVSPSKIKLDTWLRRDLDFI